MTVKNVVMLGDARLREECSPVRDFDEKLQEVVQNLADTLSYLQKAKNIGRALAAPQIGCSMQIIYANMDKDPFVMVNPVITEKSRERMFVWDSCFSFDVAFFVRILRHREIVVEYEDEKGHRHQERFRDDFSELFQHEIDHLSGVLAIDHLKDPSQIIMRSEWEKAQRKA